MKVYRNSAFQEGYKMTKRESSLLFVLINVSVIAAFVMFMTSVSSSMKEKQSRIATYNRHIDDYSTLITDNSEEGTGNAADIEQVEVLSIEEITSRFIGYLSKSGITPERYQISKSTNINTSEFNFKCSPDSFFSFIYSFRDKSYPFSIKSLNIKSENNAVTASIKVSDEPFYVKDFDSLIKKPYGITSLFPYVAEKKEEEVKAVQPEQKPAPVQKKNTESYTLIGAITGSDGNTILYIKNKKTGRVSSINQEEIISETPELYTVKSGEDTIEIHK